MKSLSLKSCCSAIDQFLMAPGDLRILNVMRPLFGIFLSINLLFLWPDRHLFFGSEGLISDEIFRYYSNSSWKLTTFLPRNQYGVNAYFLSLFTALATLTVGFFPRVSACFVFFLLTGLQNSNTLIFDGEDTMFRLLAFFFIFAPGPKEIRETGLPGQVNSNPFPMWPLRLFQFQMCLMFLACAFQKMKGDTWADGTALYYVFRLYDFYRVPMPELITENLTILRILTWGVIVLELTAPVLIWFKETRRATLIVLILFHLGTDLTMNLMMFHWLMITGWLSFARYEDFAAIGRLFRLNRTRSNASPEQLSLTT